MGQSLLPMKTCPLRLELHCAEGPLLIEPFRVDRFHADELDPLLAEHFWEQGKSLPYLKELQSLRQFKADYFVALVAGRTVTYITTNSLSYICICSGETNALQPRLERL